jgi:biopolymer transport protein ExbD
MRVKRRRGDSGVPEVNLVPMMDVMMSVLTFFIIISMSMSGLNIVNVKVPLLGDGAAVVERKEPKKLIFGLTQQGKLLLENRELSNDQMAQEMVKFLDENADGIVILKADSKLTYEKVEDLLKLMRDVGGDRVSLAVERKSS